MHPLNALEEKTRGIVEASDSNHSLAIAHCTFQRLLEYESKAFLPLADLKSERQSGFAGEIGVAGEWKMRKHCATNQTPLCRTKPAKQVAQFLHESHSFRQDESCPLVSSGHSVAGAAERCHMLQAISKPERLASQLDFSATVLRLSVAI